MWSCSVLIGHVKYTKMNVFVYVLLKWWSQRHFWTLGICYVDEFSSKFKENHSDIIFENQRGNIFSNEYVTACIKCQKLPLKKIMWRKASFCKSIGELSSHVGSTFQKVVFCLGEIFPSPCFNVSSLLLFF